MKLKIAKREVNSRSQIKALRREGIIPAVIYHNTKESEALSIHAAEFAALLRTVPPGRLSTRRFTLTDASGGTRVAILKDIQYHPVTYQVIHLDFEELVDNLSVNVKIPIECVGVADCIGIKQGGFLRQVLRSIRVNCMPQDIPEFFTLNVQEMGMRDCKKIKDLTIPQSVKPLVNMNEVVVVIAKR
jgi:large subunit ribosomal protein L25